MQTFRGKQKLFLPVLGVAAVLGIGAHFKCSSSDVQRLSHNADRSQNLENIISTKNPPKMLYETFAGNNYLSIDGFLIADRPDPKRVFTDGSNFGPVMKEAYESLRMRNNGAAHLAHNWLDAFIAQGGIIFGNYMTQDSIPEFTQDTTQRYLSGVLQTAQPYAQFIPLVSPPQIVYAFNPKHPDPLDASHYLLYELSHFDAVSRLSASQPRDTQRWITDEFIARQERRAKVLMFEDRYHTPQSHTQLLSTSQNDSFSNFSSYLSAMHKHTNAGDIQRAHDLKAYYSGKIEELRDLVEFQSYLMTFSDAQAHQYSENSSVLKKFSSSFSEHGTLLSNRERMITDLEKNIVECMLWFSSPIK